MSKDRLSFAAELLRKGGTLLSEACKNCNGVQVRFEDRIICVNCGREMVIGKDKDDINKEQNKGSDLIVLIDRKVKELANKLEKEEESSRQFELARLLNLYLEILIKLKKLG